jgi:photoactive yellow protein
VSNIQFDDDQLARQLDAMGEAERHTLPFGVILLDAEGVVRFYSETEARLSGRGQRRTVGLPFFQRIAPCMDTESFKGRIDAALRAGTLDIEIGHTGDFSDPSRRIRVRAMSAAGGGIWLAHDRSDARQ